MKKNQYAVVLGEGENTTYAVKQLVEKMDGYVNEGWQPCGSVSLDHNKDMTVYFAAQAIIKLHSR